VYQLGINKGIILRCTAYQISRYVQVFIYITSRSSYGTINSFRYI